VADPKVLQIADALIAKSKAAGFKSTGLLTDVGKLWASETNPPAAYLGDAGERNVDGPTQSISPQAGFFFYTIVKGPSEPTRTFFGLYKSLKDGIDADPTLGGLCFRARVSGYTALNTDASIADRTHVADVFVEIQYRHDRGNA
jgi:hypothetical protein